MKVADTLLSAVSAITRTSPYFKGMKTAIRMTNKVILKFDAEPIVNAKMNNGTIVRVDLRTSTELNAYYRGEYDSDLIEIINSLIDVDAVFLDIGANIGFYTIAIGQYFRKKGSAGHIFSFEPFEGNCKRVLENLEINNLGDICTVHQVGLSSETRGEMLTLREDFLHGSNTGNASIPTNESFDNGFKKVSIELDKLDTIWDKYSNQYAKIDFIKMDIEGHEDYCLEGGVRTIEKHRPTILMEVNKPYYKARGIDLNSRFMTLVPQEYFIYRKVHNRWLKIETFDSCSLIDNVFLVPKEKIQLENYKIFRAQ